jgi:hypothetical protein
MIDFDKKALRLTPYPHLVSDQMLEPDLFAALQHEYPDDATFAANRKAPFAPGRASRINISRGDSIFDQFMSRSPAWRGFFGEVNSPAFVSRIVDLFSDVLASQGQAAPPAQWKFRNHVTTPPPTLLRRAMKRLGATDRLDRIRAALDPGTLCVDFDIAWARSGYATEAHTDNRNKLAAMLIYFGETGGTGGDFQVLKLRSPRPLAACPRYPRLEELEVVQTLHPAPNRGALFLNCNNAYHYVTPLVDNTRPRQFLYVSIGSRYTAPIW